MRVSDNNIAGATDQITSDVLNPISRIPSESETGTSSSSGSISTEWNISEQDTWLASLFCNSWEENELTLGTTNDTYVMVKSYPETDTPEWKKFTGMQLNALQIQMDLNSFVKMNWDWVGADNPKAVTIDPYTTSDYKSGYKTKAFKTLSGAFKYGDTKAGATTNKIGFASNITLNITNNKERTDALFETKAVDNANGKFEVTGSFDVWKADSTTTELENLAIDGTKKWFSIKVERDTDSYEILLNAKLMSPTESKDGNKLKVSINFGVFDEGGIVIKRTISG